MLNLEEDIAELFADAAAQGSEYFQTDRYSFRTVRLVERPRRERRKAGPCPRSELSLEQLARTRMLGRENQQKWRERRRALRALRPAPQYKTQPFADTWSHPFLVGAHKLKANDNWRREKNVVDAASAECFEIVHSQKL